MSDEYANQPSMDDWKFIELLKTPLHDKTVWRRSEPKAGEADLRGGVELDLSFPDPAGVLETASEDFKLFLKSGGIPLGGRYRVRVRHDASYAVEEHSLDVGKSSCVIGAGDTEGLRRALVALEDLVTGSGGPFIPLGASRRKPFVRSRISRCFFGPIKRPPMNRDELADEVDYYPDEYLNKLAHESINGLWLTVAFSDLCPSKLFPEDGKDSGKRFEKLRRTVRKCARHGIKTYLFCIEPRGFGAHGRASRAILDTHPELEGAKWGGGGINNFCTSTEAGREYLEECVHHLFSQVPGLGGLIDITHGERPTNCYSASDQLLANNCPRCSKRKPWEVYEEMLESMARGMRRAAPEAELISWLYVPVLKDDERGALADKLESYRQIAARTPAGVVTQLNFESTGVVRQLGRDQVAYDYWLAWPGPSKMFSDCAAAAVQGGARASAKIQVGCSHENAAIPFMPVPGSLHRKYKAMNSLGVSAVMQCWYFGNYPGLMNKAAGELSFLPFPATEREFLERLARIDWAGDARQVARAWSLFMKGYANFPITLPFTWYGPLHCSIVWPLHLKPVDEPLAPSWKFGYPDSGDRIGECIGFNHSLDDILTLLGRMDKSWSAGVALLEEIAGSYAGNPARLLDIGLCEAIGLQIKSALDAMRFYSLRESLDGRTGDDALAVLDAMEGIVRQELANSAAMKELCLRDPRLGFHSEAEGYKFFPAKLDWRVGLLRDLLKTEFKEARRLLKAGGTLFPEYFGGEPRGKVHRQGAGPERLEGSTDEWRAWREGKSLVFEVKTRGAMDSLEILIEPRRLWPATRFTLTAAGQTSVDACTSDTPEFSFTLATDGQVARLALPFKSIPFFKPGKRLRVNVCHTVAGTARCWIKRTPLPCRLLFGEHNSADLGWLLT